MQYVKCKSKLRSAIPSLKFNANTVLEDTTAFYIQTTYGASRHQKALRISNKWNIIFFHRICFTSSLIKCVNVRSKESVAKEHSILMAQPTLGLNTAIHTPCIQLK